MSPDAPSEMSIAEQKNDFIAEHGRLPRNVCNSAFDPFRRHSNSPPLLICLVRNILSLFLVPLRLFIGCIAIFISFVLVLIFGPPITNHSITHFQPTLLPRWRRAIVEAATKFLARSLLLSFGFWVVEGQDHPDYDHKQAMKATILSNHSSLADPCLLAFLYAPAFVAKAAVWNIPGVGRVGAAQHAFYIDRRDNAGVSISQAIMDRQRLVQESNIPPVAIFPEGTTTNGKYLLSFRTGAFIAGSPVAPVLVQYKYKWFSPTYESIRTNPYLIGILAQLWNRIQYYRLPVYYPSDEEKKDAKLYARNVHEMMLRESKAAFGEKLVSSESNYVDKLEYISIIRNVQIPKGLRLNSDSSPSHSTISS